MPKFGTRSQAQLITCHHRLQSLFSRVIVDFDCTILCGFRDEAAQEEAFATGHSQLHFGESKHNSSPSSAADVAPWPIDWNNIGRFRYFAGYVMGLASAQGIELLWGGDWDRNPNTPNHFNDLVHFELVE